METLAKNSGKKPPHDTHDCMACGTILGAALGAVIGMLADHWIFWAIFLGVSGMIIGALIDRSRR